MWLRLLSIAALTLPIASGGQAQTTAQALAFPIRINEVNYEHGWVEIFNGNDQSIDLSNFILGTSPFYQPLRNLHILSGNTRMAPGSFLVVGWDPNRDADNDSHTLDGEVALYVSQPFDDAANMVDYVAFGVAQHNGRDSVATAAGHWQMNTAAAVGVAGQTLSFFDTGGSPASRWQAGIPTPGDFNFEVATSMEPPEALADAFLSPAFPNPFSQTSRFTLTLARPQQVRVDVFDVLGRHVAMLHTGWLDAGQAHPFAFDADDLARGLYLIQAEGEQFRATRTVMRLR